MLEYRICDNYIVNIFAQVGSFDVANHDIGFDSVPPAVFDPGFHQLRAYFDASQPEAPLFCDDRYPSHASSSFQHVKIPIHRLEWFKISHQVVEITLLLSETDIPMILDVPGDVRQLFSVTFHILSHPTLTAASYKEKIGA
jgi:hypothetical protein